MLAFAPYKLRAARDAAGLSRTQLGAAAGRHFKTIFGYENDGVEPSLSAAVRMARVLGIDVLDLLEDDGARAA